MIQTGFSYLASLVFIAAVIVQLDKKYQRFFAWVPGIVFLYFSVMLLATAGVWKKTDEISFYYKEVKNNLLPAMIYLMLLRCDLRRIFQLGPRMILGFFSATFSICLGFIITYMIMKNHLAPDSWKALSALCGSWIGGTGNMAAIQLALKVPDSLMGYALITDSIAYSLWVMLLLMFVPMAARFNRWTGADTEQLTKIGSELGNSDKTCDKTAESTFSDFTLLTGSAFFFSAISGSAAAYLPDSEFVSTYTWTVLIITAIGIICAMTSLGKTQGISNLSSFSLYVIVALMASRTDLSAFSGAPAFIFSGILIIFIHAVLLATIAKLFKLDLFTCGVASLANIGGIASAPILAAAYSEVLVPVGVLMAMLGYIIGTPVGLAVGKILAII
ncbi:MAG: DUF819 domain-containing protein [Candidatus Riflebacteria bacterium]|nr:DUF819 domain-containing protein [Candidatus Riflebacteria bacterium]